MFDVHATRIDLQMVIEGAIQGDLEGVGRWRFAHAGTVSTTRYEWHVHSTHRWMNWVASFARTLFICNHGRLSSRARKASRRRRVRPLLSQENIDLKAGIRRI